MEIRVTFYIVAKDVEHEEPTNEQVEIDHPSVLPTKKKKPRTPPAHDGNPVMLAFDKKGRLKFTANAKNQKTFCVDDLKKGAWKAALDNITKKHALNEAQVLLGPYEGVIITSYVGLEVIIGS